VWQGWRGVVLVAITYVYFLIFAQFAFLKYLATVGVGGNHLKAVMGAMAAGGVLASLLAPRFSTPFPGGDGLCQRRLQIALLGCAVAAGLLWLRLNVLESLANALFIGASLGLLTVTLVAHLPRWIGARQPLLKVGLGTGVGYLLCNFPPLFTASARTQASVAAALCIVGIGVAHRVLPKSEGEAGAAHPVQATSFLLVLACFTALVWLDSAAFFIIQNTPQLKAGTWQGTVHLWGNGGLHLAAALASAWLLKRRGLAVTLAAAFGFLACACLLLSEPARATLASGFYPVGVSLYSVALVAYPAFLAPAASLAQRGRWAGSLYAVAGWVGSALGIGMGQNLGHIPRAFVMAAGLLFLSPWLWRLLKERRRELLGTAALLAVAFCMRKMHIGSRAGQQPGEVKSLVEQGRQVYMAEGCINCHSQYVRPHSPDVVMWGPAESVDVVRNEQPPLIGNRRQGPDLAEVGNRRSALWLKAHFMNPSAVSHASFMPAYAYLFRDQRGEALVAYLRSLGSPAGFMQRAQMAVGWSPAPDVGRHETGDQGAQLFRAHCATCHAPQGATRVAWHSSFHRLPPDLARGPFVYVPVSAGQAWRLQRIEQIVKFGLPGTDMPGHEYLPDAQVEALATWVSAMADSKSMPR
jgi:cytochrome c oxidase cbb3-type subunit 2